jgi:hypothetical protein
VSASGSHRQDSRPRQSRSRSIPSRWGVSGNAVSPPRWTGADGRCSWRTVCHGGLEDRQNLKSSTRDILATTPSQVVWWPCDPAWGRFRWLAAIGVGGQFGLCGRHAGSPRRQGPPVRPVRRRLAGTLAGGSGHGGWRSRSSMRPRRSKQTIFGLAQRGIRRSCGRVTRRVPQLVPQQVPWLVPAVFGLVECSPRSER